jgi:serine/threonine-protein kinase RsbW
MVSDTRPTVVERVSAEAGEGSLDLVHGSLERLWTRMQPPAGDTFRALFETAVAEVAANILEHARPPGEELRLELELAAWPDRLEAQLWDDGQPFAKSIVARGFGADDLPERGRGLQIALLALDELGYEIVGGRNRWHLVKRREPISSGEGDSTRE